MIEYYSWYNQLPGIELLSRPEIRTLKRIKHSEIKRQWAIKDRKKKKKHLKKLAKLVR